MLVISVIVVAAVAAAYTFLPDFQSGVTGLATDVSSILATHQMAGVGGVGAGGSGGSGPVVAGSGISGASPTAGSGSSAGGTSAGSGDTSGSTDGTSGATADTTGDGSVSGTPGLDGSAGTGSDQGTYSQTTTSTHVVGGRGGGGRGGMSRFLDDDGSDPTIIQTTTTVTDQNAGGAGGKGWIPPGATLASSQGRIANTASASGMLGQPICGPALLAALTGQPLNAAFMSKLAAGNFLETVQITTSHSVDGETTSTTTTTATPGVMKTSQVADYLQSVGWSVFGSYHDSVGDLQKALNAGATVIIRYDAAEGSGNDGHFGQVLAVANGQVEIDSSTGTIWMPMDQFQKAWDATGAEMVAAAPPGQSLNIGRHG